MCVCAYCCHFIIICLLHYSLPSVLWRCWLGGRKGIRPVKTEWWGACMVICLEWGADLHMAQLMLLPLTVFCTSKIHIGFTFLVLAHLGSPRQRAVKRVCVCMFTVYWVANVWLVLLGIKLHLRRLKSRQSVLACTTVSPWYVRFHYWVAPSRRSFEQLNWRTWKL